MSRSGSNRRQPGIRGPARPSRPPAGARSIRTVSLLLLVGVVFAMALLMVFSLIGFVLRPDPTVKAGPMYVTLTLITAGALLMLLLALDSSYLPIFSRARARNVQLVMLATAGTGAVTGLLTLGSQAGPYVTRLMLGSIAFAFITMQRARLARAGAAAPAGQQARSPAGRPQPRPRPRNASRQRRGGRKR